MNQYIENPLTHASYETLDKVSLELKLKLETNHRKLIGDEFGHRSYDTIDEEIRYDGHDIDLLYQTIKKIDQEPQTYVWSRTPQEELHAVNAAYNAVYMASTYPEYSIPQMREHIYNLTCCEFNKILLSPEQNDLFLAWTKKIEELPGNATPFEIYYCAAPRLMYILGR